MFHALVYTEIQGLYTALQRTTPAASSPRPLNYPLAPLPAAGPSRCPSRSRRVCAITAGPYLALTLAGPRALLNLRIRPQFPPLPVPIAHYRMRIATIITSAHSTITYLRTRRTSSPAVAYPPLNSPPRILETHLTLIDTSALLQGEFLRAREREDETTAQRNDQHTETKESFVANNALVPARTSHSLATQLSVCFHIGIVCDGEIRRACLGFDRFFDLRPALAPSHTRPPISRERAREERTHT